ncbi:hypothetical protein [Haloplasma contractile]|uniref:Membrane lipoprotein n=1 Tax=Haloplasma contractile SSD-17B TaxID=1033810 RepID=U2FN81_9MOLU|nr:hypothetical protein [Haloplasma contractile]ERJ12589.1 membrane lipoprotein [Haloplasma contractile SSD-17B]
MKKIMIMMFILITAVALTGCDFQNTTYFTAPTQEATYIDNSEITFDPYEVLELNYPKAGKHFEEPLETPMSISEFLFSQDILTADEIDTFRENYIVELEYRFNHHGETFETYEFTGEDYIAKFEDPFNTFGDTEGVKEFEYRVHFIDKETLDRSEMINVTGIIELEPAPIGVVENTITVDRFEPYDVLNNLYMPFPVPVPEEDTDTEGEYYALEDLYTFEFLVNGKEDEQEFVSGVKGIHTITILATEILNESDQGADEDEGTDDESGASDDSDWTFNQDDSGITFLGNTTNETSFVKLANEATSTEEETVAGETYTITFTITVK